jgi:SPP1 family predicted phage head-tail adaptor
MRSGDLRHKVEIHVPTPSAGAAGGVTATFALNSYAWASIEPIGGREAIMSDQMSAVGLTRIVMRYNSAVTVQSRIKYGSRWFEINAVNNRGERNIELELLCTEIK